MPEAPASLRSQTRAVMKDLIAQAATGLFAEQGFDETTVEEVAAAAGTSRRTLFNYFRSKEDLALYALGEQGNLIAARIASVSDDVGAWAALRTGFSVLDEYPTTAERRLRLVKLLFENDSLRAGHAEKQHRWTELLAPLIEPRLPPAKHSSFIARAVVGAAIVCLQTANEEWARSDGTESLLGLYDSAVSALQALPPG